MDLSKRVLRSELSLSWERTCRRPSVPHRWFQTLTSFPAHFFAIRGRQKGGPATLQTVIKICPNRGHIFQNKLQNTLIAILKLSAFLRIQVQTFGK